MKLKNVFKVLGLAFVAVFSSASALCSVKETKSAYAAGNGVDDSNETWSAIGTIQGSSWNQDFDLVYDSVDDRYEVVVDLKVDNEFKIRLDHAWTKSIGWGGNSTGNIGTYLSNSGSGGNFKVKTANMYTLWVKDDNVSKYDDKSYGFGIDIYTATIEEYTITYHFDETTTDTRTVTEIENVPLLFKYVEGKRLEGWYTDEALTTKFAKNTKPTSDLHLYANYVEANDYWIYIYDANADLGNNVAVHIFGSEFGVPAPADWPGVAAENLKHGFWRFKVEADQGYDAIVVTNGAASGTVQTVDLSLSHESEIFVIGALSENKHTAITQGITAANLATYIMAGSEADQCKVQFAPARDFYLSMSADEQEIFLTSDEATIAAARERYEAWATFLGQKAYEAGSLSRNSLLTASSSNSLILIAIIASVIGVGTLFAIKALKHKKEN